VSEAYQPLPPLCDAEYAALRDSIAEHGYDPAHPVVVDEQGTVLDGHHRQRACDELGISPPTQVAAGLTDEQKHEYALRANLQRRHLTTEQKRHLILDELQRDPTRSDRAIGRLLGVDHKSVGRMRKPWRSVHPVLERIPRMLPEQLAELADSIAADGLDDPIVVQNGVLVDGRNRYDACMAAGVEPAYRELPEGRDPVAYIVAANLLRASYSPGQLAMATAACEKMREEEAAKRQEAALAAAVPHSG
jgi:ParB-like chromosome segregation protein Spo0J